MNIEPTQDYFLQVMRDMGLSDKQIEANRAHNGRLFLSPAVLLPWLRGEPVATINFVTGLPVRGGAA